MKPGKIYWLDEKAPIIIPRSEITWQDRSGFEAMAVRAINGQSFVHVPPQIIKKSVVVRLRSAWNNWRGVEAR